MVFPKLVIVETKADNRAIPSVHGVILNPRAGPTVPSLAAAQAMIGRLPTIEALRLNASRNASAVHLRCCSRRLEPYPGLYVPPSIKNASQPGGTP